VSGPVPHGADAVVMVESTNALPLCTDGKRCVPPLVKTLPVACDAPSRHGRVLRQAPSKHKCRANAATPDAFRFFALRFRRVRILVGVKAGQDIRPVGCDLAAGQKVLQAGDRLDPGEIGLLAGAGAATVSVYCAPTVAVLSSGDELVSPDSGAALGARKPLTCIPPRLHMSVIPHVVPFQECTNPTVDDFLFCDVLRCHGKALDKFETQTARCCWRRRRRRAQ
jgi:hypothetical protein